MPNYDYFCTACDFKAIDMHLPIDARDYPTTQPCPQCNADGSIVKGICAPGVSYTANRGGLRTPETFKDILRNIKSQHRGSSINIE